jgi:hypothetical protein
LIFAAGDELERRGAQVLGAERTHELRRTGEGYEPGRIQSGCPEGDTAVDRNVGER